MRGKGGVVMMLLWQLTLEIDIVGNIKCKI